MTFPDIASEHDTGDIAAAAHGGGHAQRCLGHRRIMMVASRSDALTASSRVVNDPSATG